MQTAPIPLTRDLVLIGGGHTHALVLRKWGMRPLPGVRVTLINPGPTAPYSGMLPGHVAGHYPREALDIDLVKLARFAGARLVLGAAEGIDLVRGEVRVAGHPLVGFDVASVDVGITSAMPDLPGFAEHGVPAKPLGPFAAKWAAWRDGTGPAQAVVIGGGVAGAELAMAMAHALRARGRDHSVTLVDNAQALSALPERSAEKLRAALATQGVVLRENCAIEAVTAEGLVLTGGEVLPAGFVTGAAGARPYGWLRTSGLDLHEGFITVDETLRSSDASVFAAGDCAHMAFAPRPKAGVYAVRQAPVLFENLRAALAGTGRMRRYSPQKDYLKLISLGEKSALADRGGFAPSGPLLWRWKDRIDRKFMEKFRELPRMKVSEPPSPRAAGQDEALGGKMLCGGCGAKVGSGALSAALAGLPATTRDDITPLPGDDAALLQTGGARQVLTTDHLRAFVEDPAVMARITAVHALGDIWAMGAAPQAAVAQIVIPRMSPALAERTLREIMSAASEVITAAGAAVVGGHSSQGSEMTIGFSITGLCEAEAITLAGARPGDDLVVTKPIGTGTVLAAEMEGRADGEVVAAALQSMMRSSARAADLLAGAHAMTDVTGFGLAGHLSNICRASGTGAALDLAAVPLLPGAEALAAEGVRSSLYPENRAALPGLPESPRADLMFDPQTAGGLLAAIPDGASVVAALRAEGFEAAVIGRITEGSQITMS